MPITEALKKLIKTITGKNAVGETIEELVQNLNENYPEGSSGGDKSPLIVHGTWAEGESAITVDITNSGYTLAEIYAAAQAGRSVYLEYIEEGTTTRMNLGTREDSNGEYTLVFSICVIDIEGNKPVVATVVFKNTLVGTFNVGQ